MRRGAVDAGGSGAARARRPGVGGSRYDPDRLRRQDPAAVFASRRAYCVGYAELAVDLLRRVGISARTVQGVLRTDPDADGYDASIGGVYHRWIEVYYPDRGYVFSDPSSSVNGVDARYIPFSRRALTRPRALTTRCRFPSSGQLVVPAGPGGTTMPCACAPRRRRPQPCSRPPASKRARSGILPGLMTEKYDHAAIDAKWQRRWEEERVAYVDTAAPGDKFYMLNMFPYPSGSRLHVGHGRNYILGDALYRRERMAGRRVLNPMGWDAFGLAGGERRHRERRPSPRVHARQHRAHEGAAEEPRPPLRLVQGARLLRPALLPLEPVALPAHVGAGPRLPQDRARQLVPGLPDRARQRAGRGRPLRALRRPGRDPRPDAVVLPHHRTTRSGCWRDSTSLEWSDRVKTMQRNWIGRSEGAEILFRGRRRSSDRSPSSRRGPTRSTARRSSPSRPSIPPSRMLARSLRARRDRSVHRAGPARVAPRARGGGRREGGDRHGCLRGESRHRREDPRLARELRPARLRHRRDHGRPRARRAGLRVRAAVPAADPPGLSDRGGGARSGGDDAGRSRTAASSTGPGEWDGTPNGPEAIAHGDRLDRGEGRRARGRSGTACATG